MTHLDVSANKSAAQAVTVGVLLKIFLVGFVLFRNSSVCFGCFDIGSKHRNNPKYFVFGFTKQTETNAKQILFRFVSVRTEIYFCLFRGHPRLKSSDSGVRDGENVKPEKTESNTETTRDKAM